MSTVVTTLHAFLLAARSSPAAGLMPLPRRLLALFRSRRFDFTHRRHAGPWDRGASATRRPACVAVRAPGPNDRLSVGDQPPSPAPYTVYASSVRHAVRKGPPIERTVPSQDHPAAPRRPFPTSLPPPPRQRPRLLSRRGSSVRSSTRGPIRQRRRCLGMAPRRRIHPQPPILFLGAFRQFPLLHVPPQGDQQFAGQRHDPHLPGPLPS